MNDIIWWHGYLFKNIKNNFHRQLLGNNEIKYSNENIEITQQYFGIGYIIFYVSILLYATFIAVKNKIKEFNNQSMVFHFFFVNILFFFDFFYFLDFFVFSFVCMAIADSQNIIQTIFYTKIKQNKKKNSKPSKVL